ncbi:MAG TPA: ferrous iron transport protein B [Cyanobacteria bacterium UBA9579]|nr:ferrous iron transport protein B [Cyanobacteria bacterium UBA9579]
MSKVVLVGNPNVGKSVFFNKFTGTYVEVSNYPGTTVDISKAVMKNLQVIDTPGIYGIGSYNDEEIVAKKIILEADLIINIVSALSLERDLFLTQQLIDMGFDLVVVLNQLDEAQVRGIEIDYKTLEKELGVKIFPTIAIKNQGIKEVKDYIQDKKVEKLNNDLAYLDKFELKGLSKQERINKILFLEDEKNSLDSRDYIYSERRKKINEVTDKVVSETIKGVSFSTLTGKLLLNPFIGFSVSLFILYALYKIVGGLIAGDLVDFLENSVLLEYYVPWITEVVSKVLPSGPINQILIGEFGLLTMTVQYILGVLLPLIFGFYIFMAILEDSGYLPRLAVLTDRFLSKIGLNGRAVIPIILGFGCTTMAIITTRILGSKRERTITTAILGLAVPCSAQLGVIIGLIAVVGGLKAWIIYLITIFIVLVITGTLLNKILPGKSTYLLIDLPPMRLPVVRNVFDKALSKSWHFLKEATPLFFLGAFLITMLEMTGGLELIHKLLAPLTVGLLNLPAATATIFIMGLIRRDFGAAGLAQMAGLGGAAAILTPIQILTSLIVLTLFVPCIAAVIVMYKERGFKEASSIWFGSWILAFLVGGVLARILGLVM